MELSLVALNEDALSGAFFGGVPNGVFELARHHGQTLSSSGITKSEAILLDVSEPVVTECED